MENIVKFPASSLDLQKTVENIANNDIQHAILITLYPDNSIKIHHTSDADLTAELVWDALTICEKRPADEISVQIEAAELNECPHCGEIIED